MIDQLHARLARLEALEDLRRLKAHYIAAVDGRDWERFALLFTTDCTFTSSARLPELGAVADFVAFVRTSVEPGRSVHVAHLPDLELVSPGRARGTWQMYDRVELDDGRPGWAGFGTYRERYRRARTGTWQISAWHLDRSLTRRLDR